MKKLHNISPKINLKIFVATNIIICAAAFVVDKYNNRIFDYALFPKDYYNKSAEFKFTGDIDSASGILFKKIKWARWDLDPGPIAFSVIQSNVV